MLYLCALVKDIPLLPRLSLEQVRAALRYYAEYPDEIDQILVQGRAEISKARLSEETGQTVEKARHLTRPRS
jgi:hypothetical protein